MKTENLDLTLTDKSETQMTFLQWRTLINGTDANSNMQKIDKGYKDLTDYVDSKVSDKVPFYKLEPNPYETEGFTTSGSVYYKETSTSLIKEYNYSFDSRTLPIDQYCIYANQNDLDPEIVKLGLASECSTALILAYVDINEDGLFDNFYVVGDKYIDHKFVGVDERFNNVSIQTQNYILEHNEASDAHSDIRDKIALLQKYPCYEYATSGGAVQRFDDVSVIPHTIGLTVHGATDENGNSVTNPTVSVYGKNMHVFNYKNIRGYTFSGSNCKIVNPTQFYENPNNPSLLLPAGTYTFSCRVTGSREYANKPNFSAFFYIGETQTNIDMNNFVSGTATFKKTFTVTEPTAFRFNNVWFIETPTSADMSLDFQLEVGSTVTEYEPYTEPQTVTVPMTFADGEVCEIGVLNAVSPTMTVIATDDNGLVSTVDIKYNRDVKKALDKLEAAIAALV